jgi:hypothetical protein
VLSCTILSLFRFVALMFPVQEGDSTHIDTKPDVLVEMIRRRVGAAVKTPQLAFVMQASEEGVHAPPKCRI